MNAVENLTAAHRNVYDLAAKASDVLSEYEGTGASLSYGDIASAIGIDLSTLWNVDLWIVYMSVDAAVNFRSWDKVSEPGQLSRFTKKPAVRTFRKPAESPVARARRAGAR